MNESTELTLLSSERRVSLVLAVLCLALILTQGAILLGTFYGDPNIYLIYARNIAQGDPCSFNPGEFSSGSTGPLWALVLAVAFLFPQSVLVAKLLSLAVACLAFWLTYQACLEISGSPAGSLLAAGVVSWTGGFYGLMLYASSFAQCLLALALGLTAALLRDPRGASIGRWAGLATVWAAVPLTRPDAVVLVILNVAVLFHAMRRERTDLLRLLTAAALASVPSLIYFGYSQIVTGHLSASAIGRSMALRENASSLAGLHYSLAALRKLFAAPLVILAGFALWAWERRPVDGATRHLLVWCGLAVSAYVFMLTLVVPASLSPGRYLFPALLFLAAPASLGMRDLLSGAFHGRHRLLAAGVVLALLVVPLSGAVRFASDERARGSGFAPVMEQRLADRLNAIAPPGARVLAYEVQVRYFLRPDISVLSLDGITDAKVAPFLESGDMHAFLLRHRPDYWVANDAVFYRPYLAKSLLRSVVETIGKREGASIEIEEIVFTNLMINREELIPGFAGHRQLYSLSYAE